MCPISIVGFVMTDLSTVACVTASQEALGACVVLGVSSIVCAINAQAG